MKHIIILQYSAVCNYLAHIVLTNQPGNALFMVDFNSVINSSVFKFYKISYFCNVVRLLFLGTLCCVAWQLLLLSCVISQKSSCLWLLIELCRGSTFCDLGCTVSFCRQLLCNI